MSHRSHRAFTRSAIVWVALTATAAAAGFPEKPIRILTPFSAGSVTDLLARPLAAKLAEAWGQPVIVDNRTGAGGSIAAEIVAKATPDGYTLLVGELLKSMAGIDMVHVAYKGSPQYTVDLLAGRIDLVIAAAGALLPHIKSGRLRLLAVTSAARDPALPDIPTLNESGLPGYDAASWYGLLAPAGTPKKIRDTLSREVVKIMRVPDIRERFASDGFEPAGYTPAEFTKFLREELDKWARVVKMADIKPG